MPDSPCWSHASPLDQLAVTNKTLFGPKDEAVRIVDELSRHFLLINIFIEILEQPGRVVADGFSPEPSCRRPTVQECELSARRV